MIEKFILKKFDESIMSSIIMIIHKYLILYIKYINLNVYIRDFKST